MKTKFECRKDDSKLTLLVTGEITGETDFPSLHPDPERTLSIHFNDVRYINSGGVRNWISWIRKTNKAFGTQIAFENLPPIFVRQAAQIKDFLPSNRVIESFVVPYYCSYCKTNTEILFEKDKNWNLAWDRAKLIQKLSHTICPSCSSIAEIDASPESYTIL